MKFRRYHDAMEHLPVSEDLERRLLEKLERPQKRRWRARWAVPAAAVAAAAALVVALVPGGLLDRYGTDSLSAPGLSRQQTEWADSGSAPVPEPEVSLEAGMAAQDMLVCGGRPDAPGAAWNTEEYAHIAENGYRSAKISPFSTFAADVDTASYSNLRRMVLDGMLPDADAVRIEEMLNYFSYRGLAPEDESPVKISTALTECPWNPDAQLLFVGVGAQKVETDDLPDSNLVFLVDVSGSMDAPDKLDLVKRAFHLLADSLRPDDRISIVTYASGDRIVLSGTAGSDTAEILAAVDEMTAGGSTNGAAGIETAYALAQENFLPDGNNRVILMTDGDLNVGITSEAALTALIEQKRETGVFLSVLGFGSGNLKDNKLEALADHGNGNYAYIDGILEARKVLVNELGATFHTVCRDVKLQVEFNPAVVKGYRLIGYENRLLAAEDFSDDTKDGGEMGSGHTVVALYEVIPVGSEFAIPDAERTDSSTEAIDSGDLATVAVRYKRPDADESVLVQQSVESGALEVSAFPDDWQYNLKLACAVTEVGMLLRDSEYSGTSSYDEALELIRSISEPDDLVSEFAYLITRMRSVA